jgi:hypothetical protein
MAIEGAAGEGVLVFADVREVGKALRGMDTHAPLEAIALYRRSTLSAFVRAR